MFSALCGEGGRSSKTKSVITENSDRLRILDGKIWARTLTDRQIMVIVIEYRRQRGGRRESNNPPSSKWLHPPLWRRRHVPPREEDYVVDTWHVPVTWDRGHQSLGWPDCSEIVYLRVTVVTGEAIRSPATHPQESHYHRCKNEKHSLNVVFATHDTWSWLKIEDEEQQQQRRERRQHDDLQINRLPKLLH